MSGTFGRVTSGDWYLGIDLGTGGVKVAAVARDGAVLVSGFSPIENKLLSGGGAVEDTATWWDGVGTCTRTITGSGSVDPARCRGIGITGQWGSTIPVDNSGHAVGPCLLWSDDRGAQWSAAITGGPVRVSGFDPRKLARWIRLTGGAPSPGGADPTGHAQFLRHCLPEVYARAHALVEPVDFVAARLTGRVAATPASMVASWLTDNRVGATPGYVPTLVELAGRDPAKLPALLATGSTLGGLRPEVAKDVGVPADVPVVCGVPDLHTAALGAGATGDFEGHIAISTTAWVSAPVPFKKTDVLRQIASIPGLRTGSYLIANNHETGGACLRWFREAMYADDPRVGGLPSYDQITRAAATVRSGSGGLIFAPWLKGERSPVDDRHLRGSFVNVSLATTHASMARAVLEGVAYNARWLLEATETFAGRPLDGLRLLGGGAQSTLWCQIHADVIGRPIEQVADALNMNVRGAAWFSALNLGHLTLDELREVRPVAKTFRPVADAMRTYESLYSEFAKLYKQQKSMYKRLNRRTA